MYMVAPMFITFSLHWLFCYLFLHCKKMFCKKTVMCWQQSRQQFTVILQYSYCEIILQFITVKMKYSIILFIF